MKNKVVTWQNQVATFFILYEFFHCFFIYIL